MKQKICENCGAKLHVRTMKCPICNAVLTEASQIINDETQNNNIETTESIGENIDIKISDAETINNIEQSANNEDETQKNPQKDYIYKAEVRHSLQYTEPLSNFLKVILTAFSMIPIIGQFFGTFFGIFFSTYDDNDRRSFGRALIFLSIIMFFFYSYSLMLSSELLANGELQNYLNNF